MSFVSNFLLRIHLNNNYDHMFVNLHNNFIAIFMFLSIDVERIYFTLKEQQDSTYSWPSVDSVSFGYRHFQTIALAI